MEQGDTTPSSGLKRKTARTLKWNTIDRLASQVLYGIVGIFLANILSQEDFGMVGAILVFQAFATIFADSGFGSALLQKKTPTQADYSTVFWFNLIVSVTIYWILWFCAPVIASIFHDSRLVPLSKVMFITFVMNALATVQINRLMKRMDVRMLAISNVIGQVTGGAAGIWLAYAGYGPWALVAQSVLLATVKTSVLWITGHWRPTGFISIESLRSIWRIGLSVFSTSMLNTAFQTVYSFVVGAFYSLRLLGVYTQANKTCQMGTASISQVLSSSFIPLLSGFQDDGDGYRRCVAKINSMAGFLVIPAMFGLAAIGAPLFHTLFGNKWDAAIPVFQILCIRGIFVVLVANYGNFLLAKGYGRKLVMIEVIKDSAIAVAILATVFSRSLETLVWGQFFASAVTWCLVMAMTSRALDFPIKRLLGDCIPFAWGSALMAVVCLSLQIIPLHPIIILLLQIAVGASVYMLAMSAVKSPQLQEVRKYLISRLKSQNV